MNARLNTANTVEGQLALWEYSSGLKLFLTDVKLVSQVTDAYARELRADEAEDPIGCDCGRCASEWRSLLVFVSVAKSRVAIIVSPCSHR